jgi:MtN3 and saliva related transmembrane protein
MDSVPNPTPCKTLRHTPREDRGEGCRRLCYPQPVSVVGVVGFIASAVGVVTFLPQAVRVWRLGHAHDLSLASFLLLGLGVILWFTYGLMTRDVPIVVTNGAIGILVVVILTFKLRFG